MQNHLQPYLDLIRQAQRCRPDVLHAAERMDALGPDDYESLARQLIDRGEDTTLGILMNVCAVRRIRLDPDLLCAVFPVIEPIIDFGPLFRFQQEGIISRLLGAALDEAVSYERQAYAGLVAAEMSLVHGSPRQPVRRVLKIIEQSIFGSQMADVMLGTAFKLLDDKQTDINRQGFLSQADILDLLPQKRPPQVIGDGQTVRRPVPKIGRNAPCHCGSGRKYKKCCMEKDQQLVRDASSYAGLTRTQVREAPNLVDDASMIERMRAYELQKLDPAKLNREQLYAAYRRCDAFGLRELAFDILREFESRPSAEEDFDRGHFTDLLNSVLDAGDLDLARKIREHAPPPEDWAESTGLALQFELLRHPKLLDAIEARLRSELTDAEAHFADPLLLRLSHGFEKTYPALSIALGRSHIAGQPDNFVDNETLLSVVRRARAMIDLEAWDDPIEDYFDWYFEKDDEKSEDRIRSQALQELNDQLEAAQERIREGKKNLQRREAQLRELGAELERQQARQAAAVPAESSSKRITSEVGGDDRDTISRLRGKVEALKAEIGSQQQIRGQLRRELQEERQKARTRNPEPSPVPDPEADLPEPFLPEKQKTVLIPDFTQAFKRSSETLPLPICRQALQAAAGFAAGDKSVWRETKPLKRITHHYRIRIGRSYRLLLEWEPDAILRILDCIHRSELETWIRRHAKG